MRHRLLLRRPRPASPSKRLGPTTAGFVAALSIALALATPTSATAADQDSPTGRAAPAPRVVASGLTNPFGIDVRPRGVFVAESGAGQVTLVRRDRTRRTILSGAPGVAGVAVHGGFVYSVIGGPSPDGPPPGDGYAPTSLLRTSLSTGRTRTIARLEAYELRRNPDGQPQFDPDGAPYDALSNPFAMAWTPRGLLVADGGANAVLRVNPRTGRVSTFFVPPNPRTRACLAPGAQANPGVVGCDSVPTGVDYVGGAVLVSTLGAEQPGAGRIYELGLRSGAVRQTWRGLTSPTGVAGTRRWVAYSQALEANPAGPPGALTVVPRRGQQQEARVPFATGLDASRGRLYTAAFSLADPGAGLVLKMPRSFAR